MPLRLSLPLLDLFEPSSWAEPYGPNHFKIFLKGRHPHRIFTRREFKNMEDLLVCKKYKGGRRAFYLSRIAVRRLHGRTRVKKAYLLYLKNKPS